MKVRVETVVLELPIYDAGLLHCALDRAAAAAGSDDAAGSPGAAKRQHEYESLSTRLKASLDPIHRHNANHR